MTARSKKTVQEKDAMEGPNMAASAGLEAFVSDALTPALVAETPEQVLQEENAKVAFEDTVCVTSNGHKCVVKRGHIIVVCRDPGFRRAGIEHPAMAVYPRGKLNKKQLEQMRSEPLLEIIEVG